MAKSGVITVMQFAEQLGLCKQRIHQFIASGELDAILVNPRMYVIPVEAARKFKRRYLKAKEKRNAKQRFGATNQQVNSRAANSL